MRTKTMATVVWCAFAAVTLLASSSVAQHCTFITQRVQCKELSCNQTTGRCAPCLLDSDCYEGAYGCFSGSCKLKPLKDTFTPITLLAPLAGFTVCAIAVLAGVGGGAILVPLFIAILQIPMADAVGLSQATICGQSILNVFLQLRRHHPDYSPPKATRPVINYEYCNLLLPIALCGTLLGSMGNKVSPDWLRVVLLITLFTYVLFRLIQRILHQRVRDREAKLIAERQGDDSDDGAGSVQGAKKPVVENSSLLQPEAAEEKPQHPLGWQAWTFFVFAVFFGISYVKQNVVDCGSTWYIVVVAGSFVVGCSLTLVVRRHLANLLRKIVAAEADECVVPFKWSPLTTIVFPLICVVAGFAASMLGIGGGLVFSSLLLEAGLTPEAASATGGLATLLVAVQSAADFVLVNELRYDYGLMMFGAGVLSTVFGQFVLMREIKRRGLTYLIVLALALIMGGSMVAVTIYGIINTVQIEEHNGSLGFGPLCGN